MPKWIIVKLSILLSNIFLATNQNQLNNNITRIMYIYIIYVYTIHIFLIRKIVYSL